MPAKTRGKMILLMKSLSRIKLIKTGGQTVYFMVEFQFVWLAKHNIRDLQR